VERLPRLEGQAGETSLQGNSAADQSGDGTRCTLDGEPRRLASEPYKNAIGTLDEGNSLIGNALHEY
jgi:cob(I)alamin adenosyltransferase